MNKKNVRFDGKVTTLLKIDLNLFGKMCHVAQKERFLYEKGDKV